MNRFCFWVWKNQANRNRIPVRNPAVSLELVLLYFPDGLQEFPIEAVSCSFSTKKTTPETLDAIKQALQPRSYVPEEVPEDDDSVDEGPTADGTNNENDGGQTSGSAGGATGGASSKKPEAETFFKEKKDRIIVLPFNFITHFAGDDLEQQIIWILLWY